MMTFSKRNIFFLIIHYLWLIPLISGIAVFLLFFITDHYVFLMPGFYIFCIGLCCSFIGILLSTFSLIKSKIYLYKENKPISIKYLLLNISNFPIALIIAIAWFFVMSTFTTIVLNQSDTVLSGSYILGGGITQNLGDIKPNGIRFSIFTIKQDGTLFFKYKKEGIDKDYLIQGYVTNGQGGRHVIKIK